MIERLACAGVVSVAVASLVLAPGPALGQQEPPEVAALVADPARIQWQVLVPNEGVTLRVSDPYGEVEEFAFEPRESPTFELTDRDRNPRPDGVYTWELRARPVLSPGVRRELEQARATGDETLVQRLRRMGLLPLQPLAQSGHFGVLNGQILAGGGPPEPDAEDPSDGDLTATASPSGLVARAADVVHADDVIVTGSLCVGFDCLTDGSENFGFDTLKLKENNLRLFFDDTSTTAGFPSNDWRIIANDSASGGGSYLSLEDATNAKSPFKIEANARTNALYVNSSGRVGLGTATPVLNLHVLSGDTPSLRLDQDTSYGWTAQVWDVAGNESNFFIRDTTGGSKMPFRIQPRTPTNTLTLRSDGKVGIGTWSPAYVLEVERTGSDAEIVADRTDGATGKLVSAADGVAIGSMSGHPLSLVTGDTVRVTVSAAGNVGIGVVSPAAPLHVHGNYVDVNTPQFRVETPGGGGVVGLYVGGVLKTRIRTDSAGNLAFEGTGSGNVDFNYLGGTGPVNFWNGSAGLRATITNTGLGVGVASPAYPIHLASGAHVTAGGVWTNASGRAFKQDVANLSADTAIEALDQLNPVTFAYKADPTEQYVGFIAEDVPALVATGDRTGLSSMDIVAVLTKVLQEQQKTIAELQARVGQLESK